MKETEIKIAFGTLIRISGDKDIFVVVNTGKGSWCSSAALIENEKGEKSFFLPGSISSDEVEEIVGQMTVEEVFEAIELGAKRAGLKELPEEIREKMKEYSEQEPRVFKI